MPGDRPAGQVDGGDQRADRRAGAKDAQARGPNGKNVIGEDRQQRDRSSEQDCEQVKQDRSQDDLGPSQKAKSVKYGAHARGRFAPSVRVTFRAQARTDRHRRQRRARAAPRCDHVHGRGRDSVDDAAECWSDHLPSLSGKGTQGHRARDQLPSDERWRHRPGSRLSDCHCHAGTNSQRHIWKRGVHPNCGYDGKPKPHGHPERVGAGEHIPAREAVSQVARRQREHKHRNEFCKTDPTQIQRALLMRIDGPSDHHLEHLQRNIHPKGGAEPDTEIAYFQRWPKSLHLPKKLLVDHCSGRARRRDGSSAQA